MGSTHENKVAIVTGASRGIGLGIARRLVADGARVVITARRSEALAEAVDALGGPADVLAIAGHAEDAEHQDQVVEAAHTTFGRLDFLVNNAGINPSYGPMLDTDTAAARKVLEVNVLSAFSWAQKATGVLGWYAVSKAALIHLTAELGYQLGPAVRVNAVAPAVVKTAFARALYEGREAQVAERYPLRRLGVPEDVAGVVSFLLSADSSWMTGQTLVIDGGVSLGGGL